MGVEGGDNRAERTVPRTSSSRPELRYKFAMEIAPALEPNAVT